MKRSEINEILRQAIAFCDEHSFRLPPFAFWSLDDWRAQAGETREYIECQLGWDITDFGSGDFERIGLTLFTIRNGNGTAEYPKPYCEKLLITHIGQVTPMHFHWSKIEDIINRGGGELVIQVYNAAENDACADTDVTLTCDGLKQTVPAGGEIVLGPGESVTLPQRNYHEFVARGADVLIGEVSAVNDDTTDNRFRDAVGRFPEVEEDEEPLHLLGCDYAKFLS